MTEEDSVRVAHSGPSHCHLRHRCAITCCQRAPPATRVRGWTRLRNHYYPPSKIGTPLYGRRPPRQTYPNTTVIIYKAKGDDLISHPLFMYDVESILLLVNALVVCTLRTSLATLERTLSTWLCTLSCLSHIL